LRPLRSQYEAVVRDMVEKLDTLELLFTLALIYLCNNLRNQSHVLHESELDGALVYFIKVRRKRLLISF
jgi:hypothetical protein